VVAGCSADRDERMTAHRAGRSAGLQAEPVMLPGSACTSVLIIVPRQGFAAPRCARP
jgi:hypothetical protein